MDIYDIIKPIAKLAKDCDKDIDEVLVTMYQLGLIKESDLQALEDHYDWLNSEKERLIEKFIEEYGNK